MVAGGRSRSPQAHDSACLDFPCVSDYFLLRNTLFLLGKQKFNISSVWSNTTLYQSVRCRKCRKCRYYPQSGDGLSANVGAGPVPARVMDVFPLCADLRRQPRKNPGAPKILVKNPGMDRLHMTASKILSFEKTQIKFGFLLTYSYLCTHYEEMDHRRRP